jgi:hypothetical protein
VGCKSKKAARSAGTFAHQVLPLKRGADEMEDSEKLEEPQGKRVDVSLGAEQVAAAAEQQRGGEEDEGEQQEDYGKGEVLEGGLEEEEEEEEEEDDSWRERIDLRAVECCDHRVQLSTPPFPFRKYWDSQYNTKKKRDDRKSLRAQMRASPDYTLGSRA